MKERRSKIYRACGWGILTSIAVLLVAQLTLDAETIDAARITFYAESIALFCFGTAWFVSGKWLRIIADDDESLRLFSSH